MTDELLRALDDSLQGLAAGETVEQALARHPAVAAELRPLLEGAVLAGAGQPLPPVPAPVQAASRASFLAGAARLRAARRPRPGVAARLRSRAAAWLGAGSRLALRTAMLAVVFLAGFALGTYGVVAASAQSLPGDALYGLKRTVEEAQLLVAPDPRERSQLEAEFAERRLAEAQAVMAQGRTVRLEFIGRIESLAAGEWRVAGLTVRLAGSTRLEGTAALGAVAHVFGQTQPDGTVLAERVRILGGAPGATAAPATPPLTTTPTRTVAPARTALPTPDDDDDGGGGNSGPSPSNTPRPDETDDDDNGNDNSGPSPSNTPKPGETDDDGQDNSGPSPSNTPEPDETDDDDGGGDNSGPSPSNTPKPGETDEPDDDD